MRPLSTPTLPLCLAAWLLLPACSPVDLTGSWSGQWHATIFNGALSMELEQEDDAVSGTFEIGGTWCVGSGTVEGSLDGRKLTAVMSNGIGGEVTLEGTVGPAGDGVDGTFSVSAGACDDSQGRFDLTRQ